MENLILAADIAGKIIFLLVWVGQLVLLIPRFKKALKRREKFAQNSKISNLRNLLIEYFYIRAEATKELKDLEASWKQLVSVELKMLYEFWVIALTKVLIGLLIIGLGNLIEGFGRIIKRLGEFCFPKQKDR